MSNIGMLSPEAVELRMAESPETVILDVRNQDEWEAHHISGATLIPMQTLRSRLGELDAAAELIVVCEHGSRSLSVAQFLVAQAGFLNVSNMVGGMSAWTGPVVTGP